MISHDTLVAARGAIAARQISSVELTKQVLDRIEKFDSQVQSYNSTYAEMALDEAQAADAGKRAGVLSGVPIAIKDNLCTTFGTTTCSSKMLENFRAPYEATVVRKLREAGAILVGKTNLDEFAMGSSTENSAFRTTHNPWDLSRVPGGSSGGSAAALAAGMCCASIGSDTGGSIRQPAAMCSLVGLKPTYGLVSRYGLVAFASSLDQIGPFGHSVADAATLLNVISGRDAKDSTSVPRPTVDYLTDLERPLAPLRIGIVKEYSTFGGLDEQVKQAFGVAIKQYQSLGAELVDVSLPHTEYGIAAYYVIAPCEASSNLARYDGVHFGHRTKEPVNDILELFSKSRAEGFGEEVQRRIMIGTYALSEGYASKLYIQALKVRRLIKNDFDQAFKKCDVIATPTTPTPAFRIGEKTGDPLQMYLGDVFTVTCNIAGIAGVSLPCGFTRGDKPLPIGLQLLAAPFDEARLLRAARMYEQATSWHKQRAVLS